MRKRRVLVKHPTTQPPQRRGLTKALRFVVLKTLAYQACDALAVLAMRFYQSGHPKLTSAAVGCISSIAKSYSETPSMNPYSLEGLLFSLWIVRVFAVSRGDHGLRDEADLAFKMQERLRKLSGTLPRAGLTIRSRNQLLATCRPSPFRFCRSDLEETAEV